MSRHQAQIRWRRQSASFAYPDYNRDHEWRFPGGIRVSASAAPGYLGSAGHVDPEEGFVAAVASCHMLTFLAICARKGIVVDSYSDSAVGYLEKNASGRLSITHVELSPEIAFQATAPDEETLRKLHHQAHEQCFIANSIRTGVSLLRFG
jgi:organic hydroperoxide reductase OsmC/OhrA